MSVSFVSLISQHAACDQTQKIFLASTPQGLCFLQRNFFFRLLDILFFHYSYDLGLCVKKLIEKVRLELPDAELAAAFNIARIAQTLLGHAAAKNVNKYAERMAATNQINTTLDILATELAKRRNKSKLEVFLEFSCFDEVISILKKEGIPQSVSPSWLEPFFQLACEKKETDIALALIQKGVSTKNLYNIDPSYISDLANEACSRMFDEGLSRLIEEQECVMKDGALCLKAVQNGLLLSTKKFIEKGKIPPEYTDDEQNTTLHIAFVVGNIDLIRVLFPYCNPIAKNHFSQTPLQALLHPKGANSKRCQLLGTQIPDFLEEVLRWEGHEGSEALADTMFQITEGVITKGLKCDSVEICFLLQKPLTDLAKYLYREEIEASISFLRKKYPQLGIDEFFMSSFRLNPEHLGTDKHPLPEKPPAGTPLTALYEVFDSLPWEKIDAASLYYSIYNKSRFCDETKGEKELLRDQLDTLMKNIQEKKWFDGVPVNEVEREAFYAKMEVCLRHAAAELIAHKNPNLAFSFVKEILQASNLCGAQHFQTAKSQYLLICHELVETQRGIFERFLADFRKLCFDGVTAELNCGEAHSVHALTHANNDLGETLGIPGGRYTFEDMYTTEQYNKESVRSAFFQAYTPYSILFTHLIPYVSQNNETRAQYLDLQKEAMPPSWNKEKYDKVYEELKKIPWKLEEEKRSEAENVILKKFKIPRNKDQTAVQAIEEDRKRKFLKTLVHDKKGKLTLRGMIFLLERLGIISCHLRWKDPSNEVIPLPPEKPYRKISVWERVGESVASGYRKVLSWFGG